MKPAICILVICIALFNSCENKGQAKVPVKEQATGPVQCTLHDEKCLEEETKYLIGSVSWSESYEKAMRSGAFDEASAELFPNANQFLAIAHPGTELADKVKDKVIRRRYCASCRAAEDEWWVRWNKLTELFPRMKGPDMPRRGRNCDENTPKVSSVG